MKIVLPCEDIVEIGGVVNDCSLLDNVGYLYKKNNNNNF
jgi:hypothetical protein